MTKVNRSTSTRPAGKTSTTKTASISAIKAAEKGGAARVQKSNSEYELAMKLFNKLMAEKKPAVPQNFAEAVERSITGAGADAVNRRIAVMFLSQTFKESAEKIRDDRGAAIALATASTQIRESAKKYKDLADLMQAAGMRINMALCNREDMQEILSLAEAENERPAKGVSHG
jgi:hypothetical protein